MIMKSDCFGFGKTECRILIKTECDDCSFYSSKADYKKGVEKINRRISSLPRETQKYIADRYYGGLIPWKKRCGINITDCIKNKT